MPTALTARKASLHTRLSPLQDGLKIVPSVATCKDTTTLRPFMDASICQNCSIRCLIIVPYSTRSFIATSPAPDGPPPPWPSSPNSLNNSSSAADASFWRASAAAFSAACFFASATFCLSASAFFFSSPCLLERYASIRLKQYMANRLV